MYLSSNIRYLRIKKGLTQDCISELLGYKSFTTIQKWESGVSEPPVSVLKKLSSLFNVEMDDLVNVDLQSDSIIPSPAADLQLTDTERDIILEYRKADTVGKEMVLRILGIVEKKENGRRA